MTKHTLDELKAARDVGRRIQGFMGGMWIDLASGEKWTFSSPLAHYRIVEDMLIRHVHHDLIVAWAKGAKIELDDGFGKWGYRPTPSWCIGLAYRIQPEPKPDVVTYAHIGQVGVRGASVSITSEQNWNETALSCYTIPANAKLVFDGETGKLKAIELVK
jgi:hypothetical protein